MTRSALTSIRPALGILTVALCLAAPLTQARPVRVFEVDVAGQSPAAVQEAMRQALVRATGHKEAATDPVLAPLIDGAQTYVKGYTKGAQGQSQVVFDGAAIEKALATAGRGVWSPDRPFTLVTLYPQPARAAEEGVRNELEQEAFRRGLAITLVPIPVVDASGREVPGTTLLQTAQRYGADQVLVGRSEGGQWKWTLHSNTSSPTWSGSLVAGVDGTVDTLAPPLASGPAAAGEADTRIAVLGVNGLTDYAQVERLLQSLSVVRHARLAEAQGTQATFDLSVHGGIEALDRALAGQPRLARAPGGGGSLVYQYHP